MLKGDFHIHGRYAQACSKTTTLSDLERNARIKGLDILGTGDCLHPKWFQHITESLEEDEQGVLWSQTKFPFIWQTEVSLMYSQGGKGRRIHYVILFPDKDVVLQVRDMFLKRGRLDYDGRPIFGMSSIELIENLMQISRNIEMIPGHHFTSWFGLHGSKSGFNSVHECFQEKSRLIHAVETGMSSDPEMNRRISSLDGYQLVSFSDNHSAHPWRLGREATLLDTKTDYQEILHTIRTGEKLIGTIETPPEYGKYHVDGHRNCNAVFNSVAETKKANGICPKCNKELTIGVAYRVEELADRSVEEGKKLAHQKQVHRLIPLHELICGIYDIKLLASKKVNEIYQQLIKRFGSEFNILMEAERKALEEVVHPKLANLILKNREGNLRLEAGYDGVYGRILLSKEEMLAETKQKKLGEF